MYARSYEKNQNDIEEARALPNGYHGVAFECAEDTPPHPEAEAEAASAPLSEEAETASPVSLFFSKNPFLQKLHSPKGNLLGSLFANTEDIFLIGLFLLLLLSKEGDTLCAVAILILLFSDKF